MLKSIYEVEKKYCRETTQLAGWNPMNWNSMVTTNEPHRVNKPLERLDS